MSDGGCCTLAILSKIATPSADSISKKKLFFSAIASFRNTSSLVGSSGYWVFGEIFIKPPSSSVAAFALDVLIAGCKKYHEKHSRYSILVLSGFYNEDNDEK